MVSVCIATYNGEKYIKKQIESILLQLEKDDEIIVSDDNSSDRTIQIVNEINDDRIKIYIHKRDFVKKKHCVGYYCSNNFSHAISKASGDYILLADQDDVWYENKVSEIVGVLQKFDICMSNFSIINEKEELIKEKYYQNNPITNNWFYNLNKNVYFGCCMAFKSNIKNLFMPIPNTIVSYDTWIATKCLLKKKKIDYIDKPLIYYRRHGNNISQATGNSNNSIFFKFFWRLQFLSTLLFYKLKG